MDISTIGNVASALSQAATGDAVAMAVLKKAIDIQAQGAMQLIQALPQPASGTTSTLGNNLNTFA